MAYDVVMIDDTKIMQRAINVVNFFMLFSRFIKLYV
ncbi:MAG: hypothetical protein ACI9VT_004244 [Psychroserpens sp.]